MLDDLRQQIQTYLEELLGEADKLRRALAALGSRDGGGRPAAPEDAGSRGRSPATSRTATRNPARPRASASTTAGPATTAARAASGSTKTAVLRALAGGNAMTAGEVASATGLGRASVSTTLSKLASSGEVIKAARGYQIAGAPADADAAVSAENELPGGEGFAESP